ncbi:MAG: nitroreductase family deazaflavin-dependent oxidoreductase [Chloroflexi bacterium]|nr:nitroreductase family deazaflavin-dependent oxidoreductase [Chloroflexota bacterium]
MASGADERGSDPGTDPALDMVEQLAAGGRVAILETRGRVTLRPIRTAIGFVHEPDGSLLVAAGDPDADWAQNLLALPACAVRVKDEGWFAHAEPIEGAERAHAIAGLIVKYGTPAERLGAGRAFRLRRAAPDIHGPGGAPDAWDE